MRLLVCLAILAVVTQASVIRREIQTELGKKIETDLKNVLTEIETTVDQGKAVAKDVLAKGHALLEQAKTVGGQVWHSAQGQLGNLTQTASGVFGNFLKGIGGIWHEIQHVFGKRNAEKRFLLDDLKSFNERLSKDMQALFHDVGTKLHDFNAYLGNHFKQEVAQAKPVIDNVKQLAENFLNATAAKSKDVIGQAQKFFEPYKHDIGELWSEIECEYNHALHSGPACAATSRRELQTALGAKIEADLKSVLTKIETAVDQGEAVAKDVLAKGHALLEQAKTVGGQVWHSAQGQLGNLTQTASGVFGNFLKGIGGIWHEIQHVIGKRNAEKRFLLDDLKSFNERLSKDMQALFHDVGTKLHDFNAYLGNHFKQEVAQAKPVIDNVKQLAENFLNATAEKSKDVIGQAQKFFEPYKHDLGELWSEIECEYNHALHSGPACAATSRRELQTALGAKIEADLKSVLTKIETAVDQEKAVAKDVLAKGHALLEQAKTLGGQVWHSAQGQLGNLTQSASSVFGNFLQGLGGIWHEIQHVIGKRNAEKRMLLDDLKAFNQRLSKDMQTLFHDVGTKLHDFNTYLGNHFKQEVAQAKPVIDNVKQLAENFLNATAEKSKDVIGQAQKFFEPYKHDLGELWSEIECEYNHALHSGPACAATSRRELQTALGAKIEADLKSVLTKIQTAVDQEKAVAKDVLAKGHALLEQAKTLGGQVWHSAQGQLGNLTQSASSVFGNFLKGLGGIWHEIQHVIGRRDLEERMLLDGSTAFLHHLGDDLKKIFGNVGSKFTAFNQYLVDLFHKEVQAAKPAVDNVKQLATNFLDATKQKSAQVVSEAKEFFQPYQHDLGELWGQIECTYNHVVKNAPACV